MEDEGLRHVSQNRSTRKTKVCNVSSRALCRWSYDSFYYLASFLVENDDRAHGRANSMTHVTEEIFLCKNTGEDKNAC
ncbi:hypothetical protein [Pyramidobacter piscolens]|uniref:hypothetical protein n=2 Tax=Pyramidobacter TaxID=638847 RepID=UPI001FCAB50D|nr:hypothetical protein [Pyramidobacter piscolens]